KIPVAQLLSKDYAAKRAALIDPAKANCTVAPGALGTSDTTYFTVVDREGNILSIIQSNYNNFGSNVTVLGMGFALQDRGGLFSPSTPPHPPRSPDAAAPPPPSFPPSCRAATSTSASASWADSTSRSRTRNSSPTSSITT